MICLQRLFCIASFCQAFVPEVQGTLRLCDELPAVFAKLTSTRYDNLGSAINLKAPLWA